MKALLAFFVLFLSTTVYTYSFEYIRLDSSQDFSKGHFDLESHIKEIDKKIVNPEKYETAVQNLEIFLDFLTQSISEKDLRKTLPELISYFVYLINKKATICESQNFVLNAFLDEDNIEMDCDITCMVVYCGLYRLQNKFLHYQIMERLFLSPLINHTVAAIKEKDNFFYADLNVELKQPVTLPFLSKEAYLATHDRSKAILTPYQGEALKGIGISLLALHAVTKEKFQDAIELFEEARRYQPNNSFALATEAMCLAKIGKAKESTDKFFLLRNIEDLEPEHYLVWGGSLLQAKEFSSLVYIMSLALIDNPNRTNGDFYLLRSIGHQQMAKQTEEEDTPSPLVHTFKALSDLEIALAVEEDPCYLEVQNFRNHPKFERASKDYYQAIQLANKQFETNVLKYIEDNFDARAVALIKTTYDRKNHSNLLTTVRDCQKQLRELVHKDSSKEAIKEGLSKIQLYHQTLLKDEEIERKIWEKTAAHVQKKYGDLAQEKYVMFVYEQENILFVARSQAFAVLEKQVK